MLVDSHAHLDFLPAGKAGIDDLAGTLDRAKNSGIDKIVTIGTNLKCSRDCLEISRRFSSDSLEIYPTCGLHPKDAREEIKNSESITRLVNQLKQLAKSARFVAIGETGLDYYENTSDSEKKLQRELFEAQVDLAREWEMPLVVHCRNGWSEIFDLLSTVNREPRTVQGIFHSWTGDWKDAKKAIALGFYISFSGIVTFSNAKEVQEVAKKVPIDRILIETDSPFLAPEPLRSAQDKLVRGSINEPKNVKIIGQFIASLRNQPFEEIEKATAVNAERLFRI